MVGAIEGITGTKGATEGTALREIAALDELSSGDFRLDPRSGDAWAGRTIARAFGLDADSAEDKAHIKLVLKSWVSQGKIKEVSRLDKHRHPKSFVETVIQAVSIPVEGGLFD